MNKKTTNILNVINPKNQIFVDELIKLVKLIQIENSIIGTEKKTIQINNFRISSFNKTINLIAKFKVALITASQLIGIPGFGKGTIDRINQIIINGFLPEVKELEKKYTTQIKKNNAINELVSVIGIGKIIASELVEKYGVTSLKDLQIRVKSKTIDVNDKIKLGLKYVGKYETKISRKIITKIYNIIYNIAHVSNSDLIITICGSYRRGLPESSDIDVLICDFNVLFKEDLANSTVLNDFINTLKKNHIITDDITSSKVTTKYMGFCKYEEKKYRIDIRFIPLESYYTALIYFTGSYQLNTMMRTNAKKLGFKLNEYGLYDKNNTQIIISSEKDLFDILKINYLEPEQRTVL
jgi:DNA polymerase beta